jgi:hypothetical protein
MRGMDFYPLAPGRQVGHEVFCDFAARAVFWA